MYYKVAQFSTKLQNKTKTISNTVPCDDTLGNSFFEISFSTRGDVWINNDKKKSIDRS